jgi:hypothetical protein
MEYAVSLLAVTEAGLVGDGMMVSRGGGRSKATSHLTVYPLGGTAVLSYRNPGVRAMRTPRKLACGIGRRMSATNGRSQAVNALVAGIVRLAFRGSGRFLDRFGQFPPFSTVRYRADIDAGKRFWLGRALCTSVLHTE